MIRFENTEVMNFEGAIRGMRNPLNSWDKSDSVICPGNCDNCDRWTVGDYLAGVVCGNHLAGDLIIGPNDLALMKKLIKAGSDHRKFMRQIFVSVDITAPLYWWKEFDTYKVATVSNSCSTMHKIHEKEFTIEDFSTEHLGAFPSRRGVGENDFLFALENTIDYLNVARDYYLETKDKKYWWQMIQLLPSSYNQRRTITLNYETLYNIYGSRRNHKLDEWSIGFMNWIKSLPYAEELIIDRR